MRKFFLIKLTLLLTGICAYAQASVKIDCPDSWGPGRFTRISVEIDFGSSDGFARYTQDFPQGFDLNPDQVPGADFKWSDNQLSVVWIFLPEKRKTTFSCFARPDPSMNGEFEMQGKLVVISGGTSRSVVLTNAIQVSISGTGGLLPGDLPVKEPESIVTNVTKPPDEKSTAGKGSFEFRIQVTTSSRNDPDEIRRRLGFDPDEKLTVIRSGQVYKYQLGSFTDYQSARLRLREIVDGGLKDAFIVAYQGGEQVPVEKAAGTGR